MGIGCLQNFWGILIITQNLHFQLRKVKKNISSKQLCTNIQKRARKNNIFEVRKLRKANRRDCKSINVSDFFLLEESFYWPHIELIKIEKI